MRENNPSMFRYTIYGKNPLMLAIDCLRLATLFAPPLAVEFHHCCCQYYHFYYYNYYRYLLLLLRARGQDNPAFWAKQDFSAPYVLRGIKNACYHTLTPYFSLNSGVMNYFCCQKGTFLDLAAKNSLVSLK